MISVMNNDSEFDRKSDAFEENKAKSRVSDDSIASTDLKQRVNYELSDEFSLSSVVFDSEAPGSESNAGACGNERSGDVKVGIFIGNGGRVDEETKSRVSEIKNEKPRGGRFENQRDRSQTLNDRLDRDDDTFHAKNEQAEQMVGGVDGHVEVGKSSASQYKSLMSEFDDYVANEKMSEGTSTALRYGFEVGDMVWGKVKSHPWWPGHIFNEAFASSSVRRTRREGYVLVAFFGDSSYGWFDPAELIPFDLHFAEKSQQTNSRNFVKAVEEAMDEVNRRRGLALVCKCRNRYNFRPANIQGYFAIDIPDYEPGGFYSMNQISKARDGFRPGEIIDFMKELAMGPGEAESKSIDFIKNKATIFAFRRAVFEEFDETYAQAFGVQPARPSCNPADVLAQSQKAPPRAPLSGPLVIAEALGGGKGSKKPGKVKDHSKKDRYLFKRRDEPTESKPLHISQGPSSSAPSAYIEGSSAIGADGYVLQKRAAGPQTVAEVENTGVGSQDGAGLRSGEVSGNGSMTINHVPAQSTPPSSQVTSLNSKPSLGMLAMKERTPLDVDSTAPSLQWEGQDVVGLKFEESAQLSKSSPGFEHSGNSSYALTEGGLGSDQVQDSCTGLHPSPLDVKRLGGVSSNAGVKKAKVLKRPLQDSASENSLAGEKKKKKKKESVLEARADHSQMHLAPGKIDAVVGTLAGKATQTGLASRDNSGFNYLKKDSGVCNSSSGPPGTFSMDSMGKLEYKLPQLLGDLHALALDPFHGLESNTPAIVRQFFLRFRSLVYQKSLSSPAPSESEPTDMRVAKSSSSTVTSDNPLENVKAPSKSVKAIVRPDDPAKAGRKRLPSDRQEEITAKRLKKINYVKTLGAEKKASQKASDAQRADGKEQAASAAVPASVPPKPVKLDSAKKMEPPAKAVQPTMLVMKFPPGTSLPSVAELKARFGRFGSLDQSAIRVFWKSSTCRVVFKYKADAHAACKYANGNSSLFGNTRVKYYLRELEISATDIPEPNNKDRGDDASNEITPRVKEPKIDRPPPVLARLPLLQQPAVQLKSCLKKPTGEEAGPGNGGNGGNRGTPRVKFMLGGEETIREEQLMVGNRINFNNNASFADGAPSSSSSSVAMDFNSKNFQKGILSLSSQPILPLPPQFSKPPPNNLPHHISDVAPRNSHNLNIQTGAPSEPSIDISQQMLSLLTRCNDVVTNVTGLLGYAPYHPL